MSVTNLMGTMEPGPDTGSIESTTAAPNGQLQADATKGTRDVVFDHAMHAAVDALLVIRRTFAENGADFDDACKALPLVHKVLEHVDRMEAGAKDTKALPALLFQIVLDPNVPQVPPPGRRARAVLKPVLNVIDLEDVAE